MKRHAQLQTLSRQHHNGLLASLLLKKGINKHADIEIMSAFISEFWKIDLEEHFKSEEEILIPALQQTAIDPHLTSRLLNEHTALRSLKDSISKKQTNNINLINEFATLLESHIRFEERIYFPEAEKYLNEAALQLIGEKLHDDDTEKNCMNYPVKFWE